MASETDVRVGPARQRWRVVFRRTGPGLDVPHRDIASAWLEALRATLPLAIAAGSRPRPSLTFAAPLPPGVPALHELADVALAQILPRWRVREAMSSAAPAGITVVDLFDVWVGAPAIAADAAAADYRVELIGDFDVRRLDWGARLLLDARTLPRTRTRGDKRVDYDLRPLLTSIDIDPGKPTAVRIRTVIHPERGAGRPEEVIAALADATGCVIETATTVRERVVLRGEIGDSVTSRV